MTKPKLYIIHGWTYTVAPWEKTITNLKKLGLSVEMLNVPGLTASSNKVWTIDDYVRWADRHLPDGAVVLGHSNGGRILMNLCVAKPGKISHLILLDSAGVYESPSKHDIARNVSKKLSFLGNIPGLAKVWHKLSGSNDYAKAPANMKKTLTNMLDSDKKLDISKINVPTSILWGANDTVTPPHQAEIIHRKVADSSLEIFPEWTHAPYISHPTELAKAIFRVYKHPPETSGPVEVTKAADVSASLALKKAAEPVVPSLADASATLAFKKAHSQRKAQDLKSRSASATLPGKSKSNPAVPSNLSARLIDELQDVEYEKSELTLPSPEPRRMISTSSVPKVGKLTKVKRKLGSTKTKANKTSKKAKVGQK